MSEAHPVSRLKPAIDYAYRLTQKRELQARARTRQEHVDDASILKHAIDYMYRETQARARTRQEHEDASITLRLLGLLCDGWSTGPRLFDVACGQAMGSPHAKYLRHRDERAEFQRLEFLAAIPDYDYSLEPRIPDRNPTDGRRHLGKRYARRRMNTDAIKEAAARHGLTEQAIYLRLSRGWTWERAISETRQPPGGNRYGNQLRDLAPMAIAGDDSNATSDADADDAAASFGPGNRRPTPDDRHFAPRLARAGDRASLFASYRGKPAKRLSSPAQLRTLARAANGSAYFGA
jgi:hypothetical protein